LIIYFLQASHFIILKKKTKTEQKSIVVNPQNLTLMHIEI